MARAEKLNANGQEQAGGPETETLSAELDPASAGTSDKSWEQKSADEKNKNHDEKKPAHPWRKWLLIGAIAIAVIVAAIFLIPWLINVVNTVSTDDAYVNGHVTYVAARVAGQVQEVLVDDNDRVKKGDVLIRLDPVPYQVQVNIKRSAWHTAQADLEAAKAQVRGLVALARSQRWELELSMQQVAGQIANLRSAVAAYQSRQATLDLASANLKRAKELDPIGGVSKEDFDQRKQAAKTAAAAVEEALQQVYAARVNLGLPARPAGGDLAAVPADLAESYPGVRSALAKLVQTMAQIGLPLVGPRTMPRQVLEEVDRREAHGDVQRRLDEMVRDSPAVAQASAKLEQARHDLDQAELNLSYCTVISEIDGIVTRRNVNPGNNVDPQQTLMAVRSFTQIWIDANFKESQLNYLRIGQRVRCEVDMYGSRHEFQGRITGFSMGTGAALSLLPPQNATGNFVKIVQRLPVRIELTDYDPERRPLFVGLSVVPYVYYKEPPTGPHAGDFLRAPQSLPRVFPDSRR